MKPKRILLARHGESVGNVDKTVYATVPDYELWVLELQLDGHYQMATPLRIAPVGHQNIGVPDGYAELMPLRKMPIAGNPARND
jgi:hypothetical protein